MTGFVRRFLCLFMLLFALAVAPSYERGSLASAEAREVFELCGARSKAMAIAEGGALYSLRLGSVERFMESSGLLGCKFSAIETCFLAFETPPFS